MPFRTDTRKTDQNSASNTGAAQRRGIAKHRKSQRPTVQSARLTRATAASPTKHAVWYTSELLEQILQHLDLSSLYCCRRVCKQFRDVVNGSHLLRPILRNTSKGAVDWLWVWQLPTTYPYGPCKPVRVLSDAQAEEMAGPGGERPREMNRRPPVTLASALTSRAEHSHHGRTICHCGQVAAKFRIPFRMSPTGPWADVQAMNPRSYKAYVAMVFDLTRARKRLATVWIRCELEDPAGLTVADLIQRPLDEIGAHRTHWRIVEKHDTIRADDFACARLYIEALERDFQTLAKLNTAKSTIDLFYKKDSADGEASA